MEGQKIEIDVCNSLAAMAFVVADQQRMFREKDSKIQELEQKCKNFAGNLERLEDEYQKATEKIQSYEKILALKEESIGLYARELDNLHERLKEMQRWERIDIDTNNTINKKSMPKEGKWLIRLMISEDFKGFYRDAFGVSCISGMMAYVGIDTTEDTNVVIPKSSSIEALYIGEFS